MRVLFGWFFAAALLGTPSPPTFSAPAPASGGAKVEVRSYAITYEGATYRYFIYAPPGYGAAHAGPAILGLHGGGGNGLEQIAAWRQLADEQGILLIAPTLPQGPAIEPLAPGLLRAILTQAATNWTIDARRVYLFGHSAGGVLAFDAAMMDSDCFAAAAVHAAVIDPAYDWILSRAQRKPPIALYIGDRDSFFSLAQARRTRDTLAAAGFEVRYSELPDHDHSYSAVAAEVNRDAWRFLSAYSLPR
jgi:polyhydroxybutyrate depolymerase